MKKYDIIIIGSGLAGLSCGYYASKKGKEVLLLEQNPFVGGRTASWKENDMPMESGLHRMLGFYEELPQLMESCDIEMDKAIIWEDEIEIKLSKSLSATFGLSLHNPITTFLSAIGNNDFISPSEKAKLAKFFVEGFLDLEKQKKKLDTYTVADYAHKKKLPERVIFRMLTPLTEGLFFLPPEKYSAYNFFALFAPYLPKIHKTRAGAFSGGMTDVMCGPIAKKIEAAGSQVKTKASVNKVIVEKDTVHGVMVNKQKYYADSVVVATGLKEAEQLLMKSTKQFNPYKDLEIMPSVTAQFLLSEPALPQDRVTFSPGTMFASYSEQSRTTFKNTSGRLSVILAQAEKYLKEKPEKIINGLLEDAKKVEINLKKETILNYKIVTWANDFYSYAPGNADKIPDVTTPFKGLYLAGDYTDQKYLQTMEGAVVSGKTVADLIV